MKKDIVLDLTMEALKGYTDLEQSKSLAEFLPLESADMHYLTYSTYEEYCDEIAYTANLGKPGMYDKCCIPCWSLAALLEHLRKIDLFPDIIDSVDCVLMDISFADNEDGKIQCLRVEGKTILDTCYGMIVKLHELKLL